MVLKDLPLTFFGNLEKDFRAEVTAAEWVEGGMPEDRVLILLLGALKRSFRKDVDAIEETVSAYDHKEYLLIKTHREGLYDMLPEGLFHHPSAHRTADQRFVNLNRRAGSAKRIVAIKRSHVGADLVAHAPRSLIGHA